MNRWIIISITTFVVILDTHVATGDGESRMVTSVRFLRELLPNRLTDIHFTTTVYFIQKPITIASSHKNIDMAK